MIAKCQKIHLCDYTPPVDKEKKRDERKHPKQSERLPQKWSPVVSERQEEINNKGQRSSVLE